VAGSIPRIGMLGGRGSHHRRLVGSRPPGFIGRPGRSKKNAIGRSRGGPTTKIHLAVNGHGKPLRVLLTQGNQHDITMFEPLIEGFDVKACLADKAYDSKRVIEILISRGIEPVIPARTCSKPRALDKALYALRYLVECCFHDLKRFRRIATRFEKTTSSFAAFLSIACATLWLK